MKKLFEVLILSIIYCFALCSCNSMSLNFNTSREYDPHKSFESEDAVYNEAALKEILGCFDERDVETLKNMFSPYKQSIHDLDEEIEIAFSLYEGGSVSYENIWDFGTMTDFIKEGKCIQKIVGAKMEKIKTDKQKIYYIDVFRCIVYDEDENHLGVTHITLRDQDERVLADIGDKNY